MIQQRIRECSKIVPAIQYPSFRFESLLLSTLLHPRFFIMCGCFKEEDGVIEMMKIMGKMGVECPKRREEKFFAEVKREEITLRIKGKRRDTWSNICNHLMHNILHK
jgi:hypothetical protein